MSKKSTTYATNLINTDHGVVTVYTDGSCNNAVGAKDGGLGVVIRFKDKKGVLHKKDYHYGQYVNTTSARMEIMAVIKALELITTKKKHLIIINSDNQYVVNSIEKRWAENWIARNQKKANMDLWKILMKLYDEHEGKKYIQVRWIKGHNGHKYNELADVLANRGRKSKRKITDQKTV